MNEIRIQQTDLWFIIKWKTDDDRILYRNGRFRDSREKCAKTYYFKDEALSWLMIARRCWESE
jgi:hypothetical protein